MREAVNLRAVRQRPDLVTMDLHLTLLGAPSERGPQYLAALRALIADSFRVLNPRAT